MPSYIILGKWTRQGIQNIKEGPKRTNTARNAIKKLGGKFKSFYLTMGHYDFVVTFEAPDDETAARFLLETGMHGNVETQTLKAFTEQEYKQIVSAMS